MVIGSSDGNNHAPHKDAAFELTGTAFQWIRFGLPVMVTVRMLGWVRGVRARYVEVRIRIRIRIRVRVRVRVRVGVDVEVRIRMRARARVRVKG